MLSNKAPWGFVRRGLTCNNDFLGGDLFEERLKITVLGYIAFSQGFGESVSEVQH